ncbi:MAG: hypothetical protein JGK17_29025 [Microcoleus sp. PH2017_10_PVI_O_A]|uniref:hypothetical protein n=1 Tax=unclassified Microcoleus TaxID=2642155 RepID=UPI001D52C0F5|nr:MULTISPECIES: hypothetical protein [unclassified Microcoleus]MCC3409526.1 hypothetical protein [Microcoleus sp. PH2017_10_PVI_O_A]MCC3463757.1 hypothetical protein [Microcoleus sp. PH2017_11_PCY_U_A]MCC3482102.1 hypothetical protein [Microcoleus sp. PH2017_12_PCY_D_A]MCC3527726.1 hypothetical protein [Microcoleus sp. PH2017_21_RUC_O_A]MCC3542061.1 hypothetical protein [Microcoleus sp. PH2017_22_RUC_O_B]
MAKNSKIDKARIKTYLKLKIKDNVLELRRQLAVDRININRAVGVGNMKDYIKEYESDFANSTTGIKPVKTKTKNLRKLTTNKLEEKR